MSRPNKPWFRTSRKTWFVNINGQQHNLGPDEKEAKRRFYELMAKPEEKPPPVSPASSFSVVDIFEKFLDWCEKHRAKDTYLALKYRIQMFLDALDNPLMPVDCFRPFHIVEWIDKHSAWSSTYRRGIITAIQRPFNWAVKLGYIDKSPIQHLEKPPVQRREQVITPDAWATIRDAYRDGDPFRDLLEFAWETGCRPQEVRKIEVRHVQLDKHRVVFPREESKGKKTPRVIYMTPKAEVILTRRLQADGLVFRNRKGKPWTPFAMNCRFCRLKLKLGVKFAAYSVRHGFATRKLEEGLDHLTVAALMGHRDGTMLARVYSHVGESGDYLRQKLIG